MRNQSKLLNSWLQNHKKMWNHLLLPKFSNLKPIKINLYGKITIALCQHNWNFKIDTIHGLLMHNYFPTVSNAKCHP